MIIVYKEYKVLHIVEGGIGTLFLGSSGIPIKQLETTHPLQHSTSN